MSITKSLLTITETAGELRICKTSVLKLVHGEVIPHVGIGRRLLIRREDVDTFIRRSLRGIKSAA